MPSSSAAHFSGVAIVPSRAERGEWGSTTHTLTIKGSPHGCGPEMRPRLAGADGGAEDRISGLPTELLLHILLRLRCARAAARAGLVCRRWRGLWALLPEIHLRGVRPGSVDAALARLQASRAAAAEGAPPAVLSVETRGFGFSKRLVASWLCRAARLAPGELKLSVAGPRRPDAPLWWRDIQLPCFDRTTAIELTQRNFCFHLAPPPAGEFAMLERLALTGGHFDAAAMLPRCPRLRVLEMAHTTLASPFAIHSPSLEELVLVELDIAVGTQNSQLDIVAPVLKHLSLSSIEGASLSTPNLEKLSLNCRRRLGKIQLTDVRQLRELRLFELRFNRSGRLMSFGHGVESFMQQLPDLHLLGIELTPTQPFEVPSGFWSRKLPKTSILMLQLSTDCNEFAGPVLHVLRMVKGMEELTIHVKSPKETGSPGYCCHPYEAQASEELSLLLLKKVEFKGFTGAKSAFNVLKLLLTSAKALEEMTVTLCNKDSPSYEREKQQLTNIFNRYPNVKCQLLDA
ncbi:hypothetical protein ACP70R_046863 [Stipagrostis hirtigluma subsp. patula]